MTPALWFLAGAFGVLVVEAALVSLVVRRAAAHLRQV